MHIFQNFAVSFGIILGFFIPLGWSIISYPLVRKFQKSSLTLVAIVSILSILTLIFKGILERATPVPIENINYLLGIIFGIATSNFLFVFKNRWLEIPSKTNKYCKNNILKSKVHMRHLFQAAILIEEQGEKLYSKLVATSLDPSVKKLCSKLADDERNHKKLFQNILYRWLPAPAKKSTLDAIICELKNEGLFSDPPSPNATEEDIIRFAIKQEEMMVDFYSSFEDAFPDAWKKMHIHELVKEERTHAEELTGLLPKH